MPTAQQTRPVTLEEALAAAQAKLDQATAATATLQTRVEDGDATVTSADLQDAEAAERFARLQVGAAARRLAAAAEVGRAARERAARERLDALEAQAPAMLAAIDQAAQQLVDLVTDVYDLQHQMAAALDELNVAILPRGIGNAAPVDYPVHRPLPAPVAQVLDTVTRALPGGLNHPRSMALSYLHKSAERAGV